MSHFVTLCLTQIRLDEGNDVIRQLENFAPEEFFGETKLVSTMEIWIDLQISNFMHYAIRIAFCRTQLRFSH